MQITMLNLQVVSTASSHCCFNTKTPLVLPRKDGVLFVHVPYQSQLHLPVPAAYFKRDIVKLEAHYITKE